MTLVPCPDCGALVPEIDGPVHSYLGASAGCWAAWNDLHVRAIAEPGLGAVFPLAVDAYCAQHPGLEGRRQAQSVMVHLASICLVLEFGRTPAEGIRAKQVLLAHDPVFAWLAPPGERAAITVLDLVAADAASAPAVVRRWAAAVWAAWSTTQPSVRALAAQANARLG